MRKADGASMRFGSRHVCIDVEWCSSARDVKSYAEKIRLPVLCLSSAGEAAMSVVEYPYDTQMWTRG